MPPSALCNNHDCLRGLALEVANGVVVPASPGWIFAAAGLAVKNHPDCVTVALAVDEHAAIH